MRTSAHQPFAEVLAQGQVAQRDSAVLLQLFTTSRVFLRQLHQKRDGTIVERIRRTIGTNTSSGSVS